MAVERCDECGFRGDRWTDRGALVALADLPGRWAMALADIDPHEVQRRPVPGMWSIAEYADHVREVLFGMRFVLDSAVAQPGVDLGDAPDPVFESSPRPVDASAALEGITNEADALRHRLDEISQLDWQSSAVVGGDEVDAHWICRHAVHDATHHLIDVERLRALLATER